MTYHASHKDGPQLYIIGGITYRDIGKAVRLRLQMSAALGCHRPPSLRMSGFDERSAAAAARAERVGRGGRADGRTDDVEMAIRGAVSVCVGICQTFRGRKS